MGQVNVYKNQNTQFPMAYIPPIPFLPMPIHPGVPNLNQNNAKVPQNTQETGLKDKPQIPKTEDSSQISLERTKRLSEPKLEPWTWSWFFYHLSRYRPMK